MQTGSINEADKAMAGAAADKTVDDFEVLRQDIARLTQTVSQLVQHQAESARSQMSDAFETAKSRIAQSASDTQDKVMSLEAELEARIERNPLTAVAVALGIGLVLGMMSQPRR